jgi:hypothetical protein
MNIISFSLWGNNPKYTIGAIENAKLAQEIYPGWLCYYFVDSNVPQNIIDELSKFEHVVVNIIEGTNASNGHNNHTAAFWRFLALDSEADIVLIRDTDSRPSQREKTLVNQFIFSNKLIHSIKDHPGHLGDKIMAGMWGAKKGAIPNMEDRINDFLVRTLPHEMIYGIDQRFLGLIYDEFYSQILEHNPFQSETFNVPRIKFDFIGQAYDENNIPNFEYAKELEELIVHGKCIRSCDKIKYRK